MNDTIFYFMTAALFFIGSMIADVADNIAFQIVLSGIADLFFGIGIAKVWS